MQQRAPPGFLDGLQSCGPMVPSQLYPPRLQVPPATSQSAGPDGEHDQRPAANATTRVARSVFIDVGPEGGGSFEPSLTRWGLVLSSRASSRLLARRSIREGPVRREGVLPPDQPIGEPERHEARTESRAAAAAGWGPATGTRCPSQVVRIRLQELVRRWRGLKRVLLEVAVEAPHTASRICPSTESPLPGATRPRLGRSSAPAFESDARAARRGGARQSPPSAEPTGILCLTRLAEAPRGTDARLPGAEPALEAGPRVPR